MNIPSGPLPIIPLKNTVVFPGVHQILRVGREKSIKALQKANELQNWVICATQKNPEVSDKIGVNDIYLTGSLCKIESVRGSEEQGFQLILRGYQKVNLCSPTETNGFLEAMAEAVNDLDDSDPNTNRALLSSLKELSFEVLDLIPGDMTQLKKMVESIDDLAYLGYIAAANADFPIADKQKILEILALKERTLQILTQLQSMKEQLKVQSDIRTRLNNKFSKLQRDQVLREQMKAIREELVGKDVESEFNQLEKQIESANLPADALKLARGQYKLLQETSSTSPDYHVTRNHLDFLLNLPWNKESKSHEINLDKVQEVLDEDHYGLEKIKRRIVQHLAVMKLRKDQQGSLLLFVGPPGVGKTSLGQSIAKALGRKYVRSSLGGLRDDAEIRGHRRTYVGAMPGRILSGIKRAGENNPVFILDEIDKMTQSWSGDPASTLLEVLDPEQNNHFLDNYLDTGFDLSKVFFIGTANSLDGIPRPLLDRMEVIELSGYTIAEKLHIAKKHLIPKQLKEHGISEGRVAITDSALHKIIMTYTREAGVRDLQRKIASICRFACEGLLRLQTTPNNNTEPPGAEPFTHLPTLNLESLRVDLKDLEEILGPERFSSDMTETISVPGVVTGLAWTPVGGEILFIEAALMPGSGQLLITGQLGDVMKESAQISLSLIKSQLTLTYPQLDFSKKDIHIHVPAGAIPKDGPSAGITMVTSMASLILRKPVNPKLAMTGEITLRGAVMPVGGIKEKVIAAHRAGVSIVILPKRNEKDLRDVPDEIKAQIQFHFVENVAEVLKIALDLDKVDLAAGAILPEPSLSTNKTN